MTDREIFRTNLANLMNETKTKQIDIAKYAEVSYQTVSAWVQGRGYPRADAMEKLCKFFGIKQSALTESGEETDEDKLVSLYRLMSDDGRNKLLERAYELVKLHPKRGRKNAET
ncbi:MAG: helix-turn-helix transcriptional regulator [Treponema sp.]|nr:helix-turn-helix transcriptional regulator [Treponema sp.]